MNVPRGRRLPYKPIRRRFTNGPVSTGHTYVFHGPVMTQADWLQRITDEIKRRGSE